jgi:predicted transcriptional regulator
VGRTISQTTYYSPDEKQLALIAKAMGHPVRIQILKLLNAQACCFTGDLTDNIPLAQSTISQHLKMLKDADLIQGEIMPPKVKYCLNQQNWAIAKQLFSDLFQTDFPASREKTCNS